MWYGTFRSSDGSICGSTMFATWPPGSDMLVSKNGGPKKKSPIYSYLTLEGLLILGALNFFGNYHVFCRSGFSDPELLRLSSRQVG